MTNAPLELIGKDSAEEPKNEARHGDK